MSEFQRLGPACFWQLAGKIVYETDEKVIDPCIKEVKGEINGRKWLHNYPAYFATIYYRPLVIQFDFQTSTSPLEVSIFDRYPLAILGTFSASPDWTIEESKLRFIAFMENLI